MKHERLLALIDVFLNEGKKTAEELAARFEVSERTIYRDIDALCAAGVPLTATAGKDGGYELIEGYRIDRSFLSSDEVRDLTALLRGLVEAIKEPHLERSLGKIAALGASATLGASRSSGSSGSLGSRCRGGNGKPTAAVAAEAALPPPLIATLAPWGAPGPSSRLIEDIRRAISDRRVVFFHYIDSEGGKTERRVEPFSLVIGGATWYLHAWCRLRGAFRLFKLARVTDVRLEPERFDPYARAPVPPPFAGGDEPSVPVTLEAEASLSVALDAALAEAFPAADIEELPGGSRRYRFRYPIGPWFVRLLLYFGPGLSVREPAELRAEYVAALRRMAEVNGI